MNSNLDIVFATAGATPGSLNLILAGGGSKEQQLEFKSDRIYINAEH